MDVPTSSKSRAPMFRGGQTPLHFVPGKQMCKPKVTFHSDFNEDTPTQHPRSAISDSPDFELSMSSFASSNTSRVSSARSDHSGHSHLTPCASFLNSGRPKSAAVVEQSSVARLLRLDEHLNSNEKLRFLQRYSRDAEILRRHQEEARQQAYQRVTSAFPSTASSDPIGYMLDQRNSRSRNVPLIFKDIFTHRLSPANIQKTLRERQDAIVSKPWIGKWRAFAAKKHEMKSTEPEPEAPKPRKRKKVRLLLTA